MVTPEVVILDCDGVLVDSERIAVRVGIALLRDFGWDLSEEEYVERFTGCSEEHWRSQVRERLGQSLPADWEVRAEARTHRAFEQHLRVVPGIVAALDRIDARTCVASNGSHAKIARSLALTGLAERFRGRIFSAEDVARGKPAPDLFLHAAARMGVHPSQCVVVEDSPFGARAARSAGMPCLAFTGGVTPPSRLRGLGAVLFGDMRELPELLLTAQGLTRTATASGETRPSCAR
jgi:HAD superfamily hydrolase (TIGR01509 family)